jgi:uncharacterized protein (DUF1501 family)
MNRRAFLARLGQYGSLGAASRLALPLSLLGSASAEAATDYKAIVCVYLYGGNDYANTVVPWDSTSYTMYNNLRSDIALASSALAGTVLTPSNTVAANSQTAAPQFALAPELAPLVTLFNANKLSVALNIGTLVAPISRAQFLAKSVPVPPQLFSHIDQQKYSQSLSSTETTGWGGRIEDLLMSANTTSTFSAISATGNALYLTGDSALQYQVSTSGAVAINGLNGSIYGSNSVGSALNTLITASSSNLFEAQVSAVNTRSISAQSAMHAALGTTSPFASLFPANNNLASQLQVVARIINARAALGAGRQVFLVSLSGFDNHDSLATLHPPLMATLANALSAFQAALAQMSLGPNVITFTASDFGRTLTSNGDGADHGWGSHHFLMGDAIQGGKVLGRAPVLANGGPDDVGQGRLIPTLAWDQLAGSLGTWLGVSSSSLATILPNLANFAGSSPGFI